MKALILAGFFVREEHKKYRNVNNVPSAVFHDKQNLLSISNARKIHRIEYNAYICKKVKGWKLFDTYLQLMVYSLFSNRSIFFCS